jgi:hypothetical protein
VQLVAGKLAVHSVAAPETNVMLPVALPGKALSASVAGVPKGTLGGVALAVNGTATGVTMSAVDALDDA